MTRHARAGPEATEAVRRASPCGRRWPRAPRPIPTGVALAEPAADGGWRTVSWSLLHRNVELLARGLAARGVRRGDRVSVLITPGADLLAVVYACWRLGATVVVTDSGLGVRGIHRALRGANPRHVIAIPKAMALVRALRLPGQRIAVSELPAIARLGATHPMPATEVSPDDEAVVAFTSGSTGPAKGVVYRHRQVERTRDTLRDHYAITVVRRAGGRLRAVGGARTRTRHRVVDPGHGPDVPRHADRARLRRCRPRRRAAPSSGRRRLPSAGSWRPPRP